MAGPLVPDHSIRAQDRAAPPQRGRNEHRIPACGDALMWRQGLGREERFTGVIAQQLAASKKEARIIHDCSRSGANVRTLWLIDRHRGQIGCHACAPLRGDREAVRVMTVLGLRSPGAKPMACSRRPRP